MNLNRHYAMLLGLGEEWIVSDHYHPIGWSLVA